MCALKLQKQRTHVLLLRCTLKNEARIRRILRKATVCRCSPGHIDFQHPQPEFRQFSAPCVGRLHIHIYIYIYSADCRCFSAQVNIACFHGLARERLVPGFPFAMAGPDISSQEARDLLRFAASRGDLGLKMGDHVFVGRLKRSHP